MRCRVCGFEGQFEEETFISQVNPETTAIGGYDDYGNGLGTEVVREVGAWERKFHVCPECRIVYFLKEE